MAIGAIKYLKYAGISIPEDVNVIGFDNISLCTLIEPNLTTIAQLIKDLGRIATNILIEKINNPEEEYKKLILKSKLIIRRSTNEIQHQPNTHKEMKL